MEDAHEREARYGQRGAISLNAPLIQKTYHFLGFDHVEGAMYYRLGGKLYSCTAYLGSLQHDPVDEEEVLAISSGLDWIRMDSSRGYSQEEACRIIQQHLAKNVAESIPASQGKGWFKTLLEAIMG